MKQLERSEVIGSVAKLLVVSWSLALVSVIVPVLHLFLVPGFFLGGLVGAGYLYMRRHLAFGEIECPGCRRRISVKFAGVAEVPRWPLDSICDQCGQNVWIGPVNLN